MELRELRIESTPLAAKIFIFALLVLQVAAGLLAGYLFFFASADVKPLYILAASTALSVGLPIFVAAVFLATAKTGPRGIEDRTRKILAVTIPRALRNIRVNESDEFANLTEYMRSHIAKSANAPGSLITVQGIIHASCNSASYRLCSESSLSNGNCGPIELLLGVDITISTINIMLGIPLNELQTGDDGKQMIRDIAPSTLQGMRVSGGYTIDEHEPLSHRSNGRSYQFVIARKHINTDNFIWDSTQSYFFAADFALGVASFVRECQAYLRVKPNHG